MKSYVIPEEDPHLRRGRFMLDKQIHTVEDLVKFWRTFGLDI